jgi:hypothetical protein
VVHDSALFNEESQKITCYLNKNEGLNISCNYVLYIGWFEEVHKFGFKARYIDPFMFRMDTGHYSQVHSTYEHKSV